DPLEVVAHVVGPVPAMPDEILDRPSGDGGFEVAPILRHARDRGHERHPGAVVPLQQLIPIHRSLLRHRVRGNPRSTFDVAGSGQRDVTILPRVKNCTPSGPYMWLSPNSDASPPPNE